MQIGRMNLIFTQIMNFAEYWEPRYSTISNWSGQFVPKPSLNARTNGSVYESINSLSIILLSQLQHDFVNFFGFQFQQYR